MKEKSPLISTLGVCSLHMILIIRARRVRAFNFRADVVLLPTLASRGNLLDERKAHIKFPSE
jgi:hypothetical protein